MAKDVCCALLGVRPHHNLNVAVEEFAIVEIELRELNGQDLGAALFITPAGTYADDFTL
jgi:hypothetical protein